MCCVNIIADVLADEGVYERSACEAGAEAQGLHETDSENCAGEFHYHICG